MRRAFLKTLIAAAAPLVLLAGCANNPMDPQARSEIRRVAIARDVALPERPTVMGSGGGAAILAGGAIGAAIEGKATGLPEQFRQAMATQKIDVAELLRAKLATQLASKGFTIVSDASQADAVVNLRIAAYGLTSDSLFGDARRFPLLTVDARMVKRGTDSSLWRGVVSSNVENEINKQLEVRPLADFFSDGELLRREYDKIAALVAGRLVQKL